MGFNYKQTRVVKGMLARGDRQHDIAAYFGVNGGRVAEVATGDCDYPNAPPLPECELPPSGPWASPYEVATATQMLRKLLSEVNSTPECDVKALVIEESGKILKVLAK